jgi:hypothetical protein
MLLATSSEILSAVCKYQRIERIIITSPVLTHTRSDSVDYVA